jgi:hypothetical protein
MTFHWGDLVLDKHRGHESRNEGLMIGHWDSHVLE